MPDQALAINTDSIEWDENITLFQLPTGAHKIHPNLKIKVLMRDDERGQFVEFDDAIAVAPRGPVGGPSEPLLEGGRKEGPLRRAARP